MTNATAATTTSAKTASKKWTDETVASLNSLVDGESPVSAATVNRIAEALGFTTRSVASKLRQLDVEVASLAVVKDAKFTEAEGNALRDFVVNNANEYTYKEIAEQFQDGKFSPKQVQGKILALELTGSIKATEKVEAARSYTDAEEATFISLANSKAFIEDIAAKLNKSIASVRGKGLSLTRQGKIEAIPAQKESHAKDSADVVDALGDTISTLTVAQIAESTGKTERGVRTLLTRRGIDASDYKGAAKQAKAREKLAA